jgi:hypothetical protein
LKSDATTGVALPSSLSLGPILTERAETIGRHKFYLGFTRQQFGFGTLENLNLGDFPTLYKGGDPSPILQGTSQRTTAPASFSTQVDLHIDQNVAFATFGLTDRIDVSAAIPVVHAFASATTFRGAIANTDVFAQAGGNCWCVQTFDVNNTNRLQAMNLPTSGHAQASATGIGDVMLRVKGTVLERRHASLALGSDLRLPTGDAKNYLGSGSTGWRPFAAVSLYTGELKPGLNISPHINVGYMVNGDSVLAGDPTTGQKDKLPNLLNFATGAEIGIGRSFTLVADYLGTSLFNSFRPIQVSATGPKGELAQGVGLSPTRQSFTMSSGAFGFKVRVAKGLVLTSNTLVALDRKGLRDKWVPLFGLSYTFD